ADQPLAVAGGRDDIGLTQHGVEAREVLYWAPGGERRGEQNRSEFLGRKLRLDGELYGHGAFAGCGGLESQRRGLSSPRRRQTQGPSSLLLGGAASAERLDVSQHFVALRLFLDAGEGHERARPLLLGVRDPLVQGHVIPGDARLLQGAGILEARHG